jgi:hypothetical protein
LFSTGSLTAGSTTKTVSPCNQSTVGPQDRRRAPISCLDGDLSAMLDAPSLTAIPSVSALMPTESGRLHDPRSPSQPCTSNSAIPLISTDIMAHQLRDIPGGTTYDQNGNVAYIRPPLASASNFSQKWSPKLNQSTNANVEAPSDQVLGPNLSTRTESNSTIGGPRVGDEDPYDRFNGNLQPFARLEHVMTSVNTNDDFQRREDFNHLCSSAADNSSHPITETVTTRAVEIRSSQHRPGQILRVDMARRDLKDRDMRSGGRHHQRPSRPAPPPPMPVASDLTIM